MSDPGAGNPAAMTAVWEALLDVIEEGAMVPVIGRDLLRIHIDGEESHLHEHLARVLATQLGLAPPLPASDDPLNVVAGRHLASGGDLDDIYRHLKNALRACESRCVSPPLEKLAAIRPFSLFVTTTFDGLLATAINRVRFGGEARTRVLAFFPEANEDLPKERWPYDRPIVFHLLGKLSVLPQYAVTQEDTLEFVHALHSETRRPRMLFDELCSRHLLIIGGGFSDWLARFFVRIARKDRLWQARGKTDYVADERVRDDAQLVEFFEHFRTRTKIFPTSAVEFVDELYRRWTARHPELVAQGATESSNATTHGDQDGHGAQDGAIFVSYAAEDVESARRVKERLESAGLEVWFDKTALEAGDRFEAAVRKQIERCSVFIPIVSKHTLTPLRRFFRLEWREAEREAIRAAPHVAFVLPVAVDDVPRDHPALPEVIRSAHWEIAPEGVTSQAFVTRTRDLYRDFQRDRRMVR